MRRSRCLREIGVDTGGSNVQFSINPKDGRMVVIEMNPRVSRARRRWRRRPRVFRLPKWLRSSRSATRWTSCATKSPAAHHARIVRAEHRLRRHQDPAFRIRKISLQPTPSLTTQMKSVGEVMAIGRTFQESLQKALRGLETGIDGLNLESVDDRRNRARDRRGLATSESAFRGDAFRIGMSARRSFRRDGDRSVVSRADRRASAGTSKRRIGKRTLDSLITKLKNFDS